jgi:hypothetical protein
MKWSRNTGRSSIVLILAFALVACSQKPPTLVKYTKDGVTFNHYSDWKVTADAAVEGDEGSRSIELEGPRDSIVSIIMVPPSSEITLEGYAAAVAQERSAGIKETLSIGPLTPVEIALTGSTATSAQVGGRPAEGIEQQFSINLLGQKVPHQARFFMLSNERAKVLFITQVATEDAAHVATGFATALRSFRFKR